MARIASNYARLLLTFVLGIVIVRLMAEIGPDAVLLYLLLISSAGIASMFKMALHGALVPALGLSIDGRGEHGFPTILWTSFVVSVGAGVVSVALFGVLWLVSGTLNFGALSSTTIAIAIASTALQAFASSMGSVHLNLILVSRRIITYNLLLIGERALVILSLLAVSALDPGRSIDVRLQEFYVAVAVLTVLFQFLTYALAVRGNADFRLRPTDLAAGTSAWVSRLLGWNVVVVIAFALFTRFPPLLVNWGTNESLTLTLSIVITLIGYQRQLSMGLVIGLDAAIARIAGSDRADGQTAVRNLMVRSNYLLAVFSAFSVAGLGLMVEPVLVLWFGDTLSDTAWTPSFSAQLFHIMSLGIAASILSEGWMKFLSGSGEVAVYAPRLFFAGVVNILAAVISLLLFDGETALFIIAGSFSLCFLVVDFGFIAPQVARKLELPLARFYAAIAVPFAAAGLAAIPGMYLHRDGWTLPEAVIALAVLGFAGLAMIVLMRRFLKRMVL